MGRTQPAGAPPPLHHPPPPPATAFPPKANHIQQQQGYNNVITTPPPQYQQNIPIPTQQQQYQQNNINGHVMNTDIMRPQYSQPQPQQQQMVFHQNQAIGVPFQQQVNGKVGSTGNSNGNAMMNPWTTGLFDCMDDPTTALITAFFPCITFGQIADVLDNGHTNCTTSAIIYAVAPCIVSRAYRKKLRQRFGLVEAPASDWIVHSMFEYCAICQEHRELTNRGINPALGYRGNLNNNNQNQQNFTMMPPKNQTMD